MARQPDFDTWSFWYQHMNLTPEEISSMAFKGLVPADQATMVIQMIQTGTTFKRACNFWDGNKWAFCRTQLATRHPIGYNSDKPLRQKPSRDELSMNIDSVKGGQTVCRCSRCGYWEIQVLRSQSKCSQCGSDMVGE